MINQKSDSTSPRVCEEEISTAMATTTVTSTSLKTATWAELPQDVTEQCLSRVPRRFQGILCLVSKSFCNFLSSSDWYKERERLGVVEPVVLVEVHRNWHSFRETINGNKKLVEFPLMSTPITNWLSSLIGVGSCVVAVGGSFDLGKKIMVRDFAKKPHENGHANEYISAHSVTHSALGVIGGKVYALGLCLEEMVYRCQVLDLKSGKCESIDVSSTLDANPPLTKLTGLVMNKKIYVHRRDMGSFVFDPVRGSLEKEETLDIHLTETSCVIDNAIYSFSLVDGCIYVFNGREWRRLQNIEVGNEASEVQLVNHRGDLLVVYRKANEIWGREIRVTISEGGERMGQVVWSEILMKTDKIFPGIGHVLSITL